MISIGSIAPDFTLKDQNKKNVTLSKFIGKKIILSFRLLDSAMISHGVNCSILAGSVEPHVLLSLKLTRIYSMVPILPRSMELPSWWVGPTPGSQ